MDRHESAIMREIENAESMIDHDYLQQLTSLEVLRSGSGQLNYERIRLFRLSRLIYNSCENVAQKFACVLGALQICPGNTFLFLKGTKDSIEIFVGIRAYQSADVQLLGDLLHDGLLGNFTGSRLAEITGEEKARELEQLTYYDEGDRVNIASVNLIPSRKKDLSPQGLEKLVDTMLGQEYTCLIIASPVPSEELKARIRGFQNLYSCISPFAKTSMSVGENKGVSITESTARSVSDSITESVGTATGKFTSHSDGRTSSMGIGGPLLLGLSISSSTTRTDTFGSSKTENESKGTTTSTGVTRSESQSTSSGTSQNITVEYVNKTAQRVLEKIDQHCSRLRESASYGLWESAVFFLSPQIQTSIMAASAFRSQLTGDESSVENACINLFTRRNRRQLQSIQEYLQACEIPSFNIHSAYNQRGLAVSATNYVSGKELAELFALPLKPLPGIAVTSIAEFGRSVNTSASEDRRTLRLGNMHHMGMDQSTEVDLDLDSLTSHCFITGTTGSGKSNTVYQLIDRFIEQEIPFLVIEPAKGEYKRQYCRFPGIRIYTTNPYTCEFLKMNPFRFDPGIHILEHLDRLIEIFNTCWEMYAAMPAILKDAIEAIYIRKGWDLLNSAYLGKGTPEYPTFADLLAILPDVIAKSNYSSDTKSDYTGALVTRVRSLTNGIYGQIFTGSCDIDDPELFDRSTIIDLSRIGSTETRSLVMGIIVLRLTEYRQANADQMNAGLRHVTVLEEAHNLLKNFRAGNAIANSVAMKSVEMISNSIAEMRTYGEGFIIVDQSPTSVDESTIKNTNTKIIMRLPDKADCVLAGHALSLKDGQVAELPRLNRGIAVVMQNDWLESVLVHIPRASDEYQGMPETVDYARLKAFKSRIVSLLLDEYAMSDRRDIERIDRAIDAYEISEYKKFEIRKVLNELHRSMPSGFDSIKFGKVLLQLSGGQDAFRIAEHRIKRGSQDKEYDERALQSWYLKLDETIQNCIELDRTHRDILIKYMIYAKGFEETALNYRELYRRIY